MSDSKDLPGFTAFFRAQCPPERPELQPGRVIGVERSGITVLVPGVGGDGPPGTEDASHRGHALQLPIPGRFFDRPRDELPTVGDWVLLEPDGPRLERVLERSGLFARRAAGGDDLQLIAANVDTVLLVSACNREFSLPRLERYLALTLEAGAMPVVVLTKRDQSADPEPFARAAGDLRPGLVVELVNALDADELAGVRAWCTAGSTVALLGSSGVGKSTLLNSLAGRALQDTGAARADDQRGRHTTTSRSLHLLPSGCWMLDSPGMRELGLAGVEAGLQETFAELLALAEGCRFRDCGHGDEPGCAVQRAIAEGRLEARRLDSWRKLQREDRYASETIAERRARTRRFGRMVSRVQRGRERGGA